LFLFTFLILFQMQAQAQILPFKLYNSQGEEVAVEQMIDAALQHEVVLFGELHNNSLVHWLQLQVLRGMHQEADGLVLGGEFFERDDQIKIDEWQKGLITEKNFEAEAKLWNNYGTDYRPLMQFALEHEIPFVATNVPRRYASAVSREGLGVLEQFSEDAEGYMPPLPIEVDRELSSYAAMKEMMHGGHLNADHMVSAQALKDATMAHFILKGLEGRTHLLHINGAYHSNDYEGIAWYLKHYSPEVSLMTISVAEQENIHQIEEETAAKADYIIVLPLDSPKSY